MRKSHCNCFVFSFLLLAVAQGIAQNSPQDGSPVSVSVYDRTRVDAWQWFAAPPENNNYGYVESLLRLGIAQRLHHWDWQLELSQPAVLDVPNNAVSSVTAQGQLGLGGTYYAANANTDPAAAFLKQGFVRLDGENSHLRAGRFEYFDGQETQPHDTTLAWLQINRIGQRLIGNFSFSNAQRSFDGLDAHWNTAGWDFSVMAARADQGLFNMNGNPELNVDVQYAAATRSEFKQHLLWRVFAVGYHDGAGGACCRSSEYPHRELWWRFAHLDSHRSGRVRSSLLGCSAKWKLGRSGP